MALFGSDFNPTTPRDTDSVASGASEIRDLKRRIKDFVGVLFDPETGALKQVLSFMSMFSSDPSNPALGTTYYNTTDATAYIYTSGGWVSLLKPSLPVGTLVYHTGTIASITSAFTGIGGEWKFANGAAVSRTTYADYFAMIGTTYGVGDGSTTFNIPDLQDKFIVSASADDSGLAKSTVSDGSTLLKSRVFTPHNHGTTVSGNFNDNGGTRTYATANDDSPHAIPPFNAQVPVIRVK